MEDYLKGPISLTNKDTESFHASIIQKSKSLSREVELQSNALPDDVIVKCTTNNLPGYFDIIFSIITINGHIAPDFLLKCEPAFISSNAHQNFLKTYRTKSAIVYYENLGFFKRQIHKKTGINLCFQWIFLVLKAFFRWRYIEAKWKESKKTLSSIEFWHDYLN